MLLEALRYCLAELLPPSPPSELALSSFSLPWFLAPLALAWPVLAVLISGLLAWRIHSLLLFYGEPLTAPSPSSVLDSASTIASVNCQEDVHADSPAPNNNGRRRPSCAGQGDTTSGYTPNEQGARERKHTLPSPPKRENRAFTCPETEWLSTATDEELFLRFDISARGFLPRTCVQRLPPAFEVWERFAENLSSLNIKGHDALCNAMDGLEPIDRVEQRIASLSLPQLKRANYLLSVFSHCYVNGGQVAWSVLQEADGEKGQEGDDEGRPVTNKQTEDSIDSRDIPRLPRYLAIPLFHVSKRLGMPPVLTASAMDMWNWTFDESPSQGTEPTHDQNQNHDRHEPRSLHAVTAKNMRLITSITGTQAERGFHAIPCAMQDIVGPLLPSLLRLPLSLLAVKEEGGAGQEGSDGQCKETVCAVQAVATVLRELALCIRRCRTVFSDIPNLVDLHVFYDVYRPLLAGWHPHGLVLEGVAREEKIDDDVHQNAPQDRTDSFYVTYAKGPSAGQSAFILLFDALLGIQHQGEARAFQTDMLHYLPSAHRDLLLLVQRQLKQSGNVRDALLRHRGRRRPEDAEDPAWTSFSSNFSACVRALSSLRSFHLHTASRYLKQTDKGTGASSFRSMLSQALKATIDTTTTKDQASVSANDNVASPVTS